METAYFCDAIRTPFGRYGGALASVRTDDLAAIPKRGALQRSAKLRTSRASSMNEIERRLKN
jgi:acetyl-CoA acyltransferase